jgi:hypothetical protein
MEMLEQPDLRPINTKEFVLAEDYTRAWTEAGKRCRQITKAGYVTDIASVPRFVWSLSGITPDGLHRAAALLHDRRYQRRGLMTKDDICGAYQEFDPLASIWVGINREFSREACDRQFLADMLAAGESAGVAHAMFWAVRLFGWAAW